MLKQTISGSLKLGMKVAPKPVNHLVHLAKGSLKTASTWADQGVDFLDNTLAVYNEPEATHAVQAVFWQRFEHIKEQELGGYIGYYLINLAKEAKWSFEQQDQIYMQYGRHLGLPSPEPSLFVQDDPSAVVLTHLLSWLEAQGRETFPRLGLFDNYQTAFKFWGEQEAQYIFNQWPTHESPDE